VNFYVVYEGWNWMIFDNLLSVINNGDMADILTIIESSLPHDPQVGKMMIVYENGKVEGDLDKEVMDKLLAAVQETAWNGPVVICLEDFLARQYRIFWDRVVHGHKAIVLGGGHISQPLVRILAILDFEVTVVDDRPEFANAARFPNARTVICDSFQRALESLQIDRDAAVIIVTRGHRYDLDCLRAVMHRETRYLGMIGSRKRVREIMELLQQEGAPPGLRERLKAPIGLAIKAETPQEIAVSIAAEIISVFRGGSGRSLSREMEVLHGPSYCK
jgi:xanthine dehydrogenase accessory factor